MQELNLPFYPFKIKSNEKQMLIFDEVRKKDIVLTPEEWVRQHVVQFLIHYKKYPSSLIAIEKQLTVNNLKKRFDVLIFDKHAKPNIIIECKAPKVSITQETFDQIARYNLKINANFLMVTNGLQHYFCRLDSQNEQYIFLEDIPDY